MLRFIAFLLGAGLIVLGGIAFVGAIELLRNGAGTEALAQGFLVPVSLILVGGFVIWMGLKGRSE